MPAETIRQTLIFGALCILTVLVITSSVLTGVHEPEATSLVAPVGGGTLLLLGVLGMVTTDVQGVAVSLLRRLIRWCGATNIRTLVYLLCCVPIGWASIAFGYGATGTDTVTCDTATMVSWKSWRGRAKTAECGAGKSVSISYWAPFGSAHGRASLRCLFPGSLEASPKVGGGQITCGSAPIEDWPTLIQGRLRSSSEAAVSGARLSLRSSDGTDISGGSGSRWVSDDHGAFKIKASTTPNSEASLRIERPGCEVVQVQLGRERYDTATKAFELVFDCKPTP